MSVHELGWELASGGKRDFERGKKGPLRRGRCSAGSRWAGLEPKEARGTGPDLDGEAGS